jgi:hypothetical protein
MSDTAITWDEVATRDILAKARLRAGPRTEYGVHLAEICLGNVWHCLAWVDAKGETLAMSMNDTINLDATRARYLAGVKRGAIHCLDGYQRPFFAVVEG